MPFPAGGWLTGVLLLVFAFIGRAAILREEVTRAPPAVAAGGGIQSGPAPESA